MNTQSVHEHNIGNLNFDFIVQAPFELSKHDLEFLRSLALRLTDTYITQSEYLATICLLFETLERIGAKPLLPWVLDDDEFDECPGYEGVLKPFIEKSWAIVE